MATTETSWIDSPFLVHGTGVPNADCGSFPIIKVGFRIIFDRADGSDAVSWHTEGMYWNSGDQSGKFDYPIHVCILVNGSSFATILSKEWTSGNGWASHVTVSNQSGTFDSTVDSTNVAIYVKSSPGDLGCYHGSGSSRKPCYTGTFNRDGTNYTCIYDVGGVPIPQRSRDYIITYQPNGGSGSSWTQTLTDPGAMTLTTQVPTYPVNIRYHNNSITTQTVYRPFNHWNTNSFDTGDSYFSGDTYHGNSDCSLFAIWDNASFIVNVALDKGFFVLTYDANGGTVSRESDSFERNKLGYNTSPSASTATYLVGATKTTSTDLDLYPIYSGSVTVNSINFPIPTRSGYQFNGWYTASSGGTKITGMMTLTANTRIYAHWEPKPYHKFQPNSTWSNEGPYVLKFNGTSWERIAHIKKFEDGQWKDIST